MKKERREREISLLGRVFLFFRENKERIKEKKLLSRLISRQKQLAGYETDDSPREAKLAFGFGMARVITVSFLCVFLAVTLLFGGSIISYENVYYMFKDIGYISSFSESRPETLNYSRPVSNQEFSTFKNGLAVVGDSEIKFFTSTGRATLTVGSDYTNPRITCSDSLALIYDQGRNSFAIYNSFISLHNETLDYPISSAHMSKNGSFCVVTKSNSYGSVVRIYDEKFRLESEYSKNDYVISARMSDDGRYVAVMSIDAASGQSLVRLNIMRRGEREIYSSAVLYDVMPYTASFVSADRIALVCDELVAFYDLKGNLKEEYGYPGKLADLSLADGGVAMIFDEESVSESSILTVLDQNGNVQHTEKIMGAVSDVALRKGYAYLLLEDRVIRIDTALGFRSSVAFTEDNASLTLFENGEVAACTEGMAYYLSFD